MMIVKNFVISSVLGVGQCDGDGWLMTFSKNTFQMYQITKAAEKEHDIFQHDDADTQHYFMRCDWQMDTFLFISYH